MMKDPKQRLLIMSQSQKRLKEVFLEENLIITFQSEQDMEVICQVSFPPTRDQMLLFEHQKHINLRNKWMETTNELFNKNEPYYQEAMKMKEAG